MERKAKRAKLSEKDLDIYNVEAHPVVGADALGPLVASLFSSQQSQQDEAVLSNVVQKVGRVQSAAHCMWESTTSAWSGQSLALHVTVCWPPLLAVLCRGMQPVLAHVDADNHCCVMSTPIIH